MTVKTSLVLLVMFGTAGWVGAAEPLSKPLLADAAAVNALTPTRIVVEPTFESVGVQVLYSGDANFNATGEIQYRAAGEDAWRTGHYLMRISDKPGGIYAKQGMDPDGKGAVNPRFATSLMYLKENTEYEVKVTMADADGNSDARAEMMLAVLDELKINSTWCIILPGFSPQILRKVEAAGHELATHFDAMEEGQVWSRENFHRQVAELNALFGQKAVSNKNHYLRWEGDDEFWHWCAQEGIQLDQSKGPSKIGCSGFNFGTCHPHFPLARDGTPIDVLSLPTLTQDLPVTFPAELADALLAGTLAVHGIMHVLFHQGHIDKPQVADTIRRIVRESPTPHPHSPNP